MALAFARYTLKSIYISKICSYIQSMLNHFKYILVHKRTIVYT